MKKIKLFSLILMSLITLTSYSQDYKFQTNTFSNAGVESKSKVVWTVSKDSLTREFIDTESIERNEESGIANSMTYYIFDKKVSKTGVTTYLHQDQYVLVMVIRNQDGKWAVRMTVTDLISNNKVNMNFRQ